MLNLFLSQHLIWALQPLYWSVGTRIPQSAQWWEHSLPTSVARVWFPDSASYVGWVCCWFSFLLREVFLRVLWFSPLLKNQHFQIPIRSGLSVETDDQVLQSWSVFLLIHCDVFGIIEILLDRSYTWLLWKRKNKAITTLKWQIKSLLRLSANLLKVCSSNNIYL